MSSNRVEIIGNLTHDPQLRKTRNGKDVCNFNVATDDSWKDEATGEVHKKTSYHQIAAFGGYGRAVFEYLKAGDECRVIGKLTYNVVERSQLKAADGTMVTLAKPVKITYPQVRCTERVEFLRKAKRNQAQPVDAARALPAPTSGQKEQEEQEAWEQWEAEKAQADAELA